MKISILVPVPVLRASAALPFAGLGQDGTLAAPGWMERLELNGLARILLIGLFALAWFY